MDAESKRTPKGVRAFVRSGLFFSFIAGIMVGSAVGALIASAIVSSDLTISPSAPPFAISIFQYSGGCTTTPFVSIDLGTLSGSTTFQFCVKNVGTNTVYWSDDVNNYDFFHQSVDRQSCRVLSDCSAGRESTNDCGAQDTVWTIAANSETLITLRGSCGSISSESEQIIESGTPNCVKESFSQNIQVFDSGNFGGGFQPNVVATNSFLVKVIFC